MLNSNFFIQLLNHVSVLGPIVSGDNKLTIGGFSAVFKQIIVE